MKADVENCDFSALREDRGVGMKPFPAVPAWEFRHPRNDPKPADVQGGGEKIQHFPESTGFCPGQDFILCFVHFLLDMDTQESKGKPGKDVKSM